MKRSSEGGVQALEAAERISGIRVGRVVALEGDGRVFVDFPGNSEGPVAARLAGAVELKALRQAVSDGREVLLAFENNDPKRPIVLDTLQPLFGERSESPALVLDPDNPDDVTVDGKRVTFDARDEIVLRCGKASITLTRAGKILIRGAYLLSRSSGVNRIKGGSVQVN